MFNVIVVIWIWSVSQKAHAKGLVPKWWSQSLKGDWVMRLWPNSQYDTPLGGDRKEAMGRAEGSRSLEVCPGKIYPAPGPFLSHSASCHPLVELLCSTTCSTSLQTQQQRSQMTMNWTISQNKWFLLVVSSQVFIMATKSLTTQL
jgi:hypothetical protein